MVLQKHIINDLFAILVDIYLYMIKRHRPKYEVGSEYNVDHKSWILAEVTSRNVYVLQYEDAGGTYHTMRLTESEMDNVVKTKRIYGNK
tara:strand:+ start:60 stop:326 length:267 start_codon:yes stop_codon:yes gene_type:complete